MHGRRYAGRYILYHDSLASQQSYSNHKQIMTKWGYKEDWQERNNPPPTPSSYTPITATNINNKITTQIVEPRTGLNSRGAGQLPRVPPSGQNCLMEPEPTRNRKQWSHLATLAFMGNSLKLGTKVWHGNQRGIANNIRIHVPMRVCHIFICHSWKNISPFDLDPEHHFITLNNVKQDFID